VDVDLPRSRQESTALFAEETASLTGRRMGEEANVLHRAKQKLSEEEIMAAEIAKVNREVRRKKEGDPAVREALRFPGLRGDTGELGLSNLTFDKRRNLVGDESIGTKFQSYHDLREMDFQDMKRRIDEGQLSDVSIAGKLSAKVRGMAATAGDDPAVRASLSKDAMEKKALRARLFDIKPGDKLFREAGLHYGRETELLLPIYHKLKAMVEQDKSTEASVLRQYDQAASLLGKDSITAPADMATLGQLVKADREGFFMRSGGIKKSNGGSIPFYQSGGLIPQSGPIYAHKGEMVLPSGFAEGGLVENSSATAALKEGTIKLEDNGLADKIAEKIKEAIETSEVRIEEDAVVKVDVTDVSIPVDVGDSKIQVDTTNVTVGVDSGQSTIPVDISSAADAIGDAITQALANASVDVNVNQTGGGAVGADGIDELSRTIQAVDDRIIEVKDNLDTSIESMRGEVSNTIQTEISAQVERAITRVQQDVNEHTNRLSHVNGQITRFEHQMDHRIREVDRIAKDAQNLAQRPPTNVPLI